MFEQNSYTMPGTAREFMYKVYGWMSVALAVTAAIAYYVGTTPAIYTQLFNSMPLLIGIVIAQVALVVFLSWKIMSLSHTEAVCFMAYAMLVALLLPQSFDLHHGFYLPRIYHNGRNVWRNGFVWLLHRGRFKQHG